MQKTSTFVLFVLLFALIASHALAEPFVWPAAWSADAEAGFALEDDGEMVFRDASLSGPRTFNRFVSSEQNTVVNFEETFGARLLSRDLVTNDWVPYAAESYEEATNEDGTVTIDVKLREGLKWSDGNPITVDDYLLSFTLATDPEVGKQSYDGWFINDEPITLEKLDENTLRFTFPTADRIAYALVAFHIPTPSQVFADAYAEGGSEAVNALWGTETDPSELVVSGAWKLKEYVPDERLIFEKNPYFGEWNVDEAENPLPYIDTYIETIADQSAQLNLYLAGEIDAYSPSNLDEVGTINVAVNNGDIDAVVLDNISPRRSSLFYAFNWNYASDPFKQEFFRDARFRKAMSHLTDREAIIELVNGGAAAPAYSNVYQVMEYWYNPDVIKYEFDPEAALALLAEMGFTEKNEDGFLVDADGNELGFKLATNSGNADREQTIQIIADTMREYGVNVEPVALEFNLLVDQLLSEGEDRNWEAIMLSLSGSSEDWPFSSNAYDCETGNMHLYNRSGACMTEEEDKIFELFTEGRGTLDNEKARDIAFEIQNVTAELQPLVYTVSPLAHYSWLNKVKGEHPLEYLNTLKGSREFILTFIE